MQMASEDIAFLEKQNKVLYNQLITLSNSQIDDAQEALIIIANAQNEISAIKENFKQINDKMKENQDIISNYALIKEVQNALTNVSMAREWLARVLRLMREVKELRKILKFEKAYFEEEEEEKEHEEEEDDDDDDDEEGEEEEQEKESEEESSDEEFDVAAYDLDEILQYDEENEDSMLLKVHGRINELETFRQTVFAEVCSK
jgi:cobalamin biosynthesis protein CobT